MTNGIFNIYYSDNEYLCSFIKKSDCQFEKIILQLQDYCNTVKEQNGRLYWGYLVSDIISFFNKKHGTIKMTQKPSKPDRSYIICFDIAPLDKYDECMPNSNQALYPLAESLYVKIYFSSGEIIGEMLLSEWVKSLVI